MAGQLIEVADIRIRFMKLGDEDAKKALDALSQTRNYDVEVDYSLTLDALIALGHYDQVAPIINSKYFPPLNSGKQHLPIKLVRFSDYVYFPERIKILNLLGLRPIDAHELIALGNQYPDLQNHYSIAALGQNTDPLTPDSMSADFPILLSSRDDRQRFIGNWVKFGWLKGWCFAVTPA